MNLFVEAVVVGIATVIMGTLVSQGLQFMSPPIKSACKGWNRYYES